MRKVEDDNRIVAIDVIPNRELEALILSFGDDIEVLEPQWFRKQIADKIKSNYQKYFTVQKDCIDAP